MDINFILVASGSVTTIHLRVILSARDLAEAKAEAEGVALALSRADFWRFTLYSEVQGKIARDANPVADISIKHVAPVASIKDLP